MSARSISVRLDDEAFWALRTVAGNKLSQSEAVRVSLVEAANKRQSSAALVREAKAVAANPDDRAEMGVVSSLMEDLRESW